jgi:alkanesulfonate monooxygenase SsuD/methylene tetrahydromethanopterin reductase-like flavin-dependent oxidoreductase (luciferase family)
VKFGLIYELALPIEDEQKGRTEKEVFDEALEQIVYAEENGFDYVWAVEHHFLEDLSRSSAPEVFLSAAAALTKKIRIGHGVVLMPPPFNHPYHTAERIAALDIISGGRVEFGAGRSITMEELGGFNVPPEDTREMLKEVVPLFAKIWRNREFEGFEGRFVSLPPRVVVPKPIQKPHPPMWMACTSPTSFQMAGDMGLGSLCFTAGTPQDLRANIDVYEKAIENAKPVGDFINKQTSGFTVLRCAPDNETAMERGGVQGVSHWGRVTKYFGEIQHSPGYSEYQGKFTERQEMAAGDFDLRERAQEMIDDARMCVGDPDVCARVVAEYEKIGLDQFMGIVQYGNITHAESMESIRLMGEEVIPRFRKK